VTSKQCTKCKQEKELSEFYGKSNMSWCKVCHSNYVLQKRKENPEKCWNYYRATISEPNLIFNRKKANAKSYGISFTLSKEEFIRWYKGKELLCHYCGIRPEDFPKTGDRTLLRRVNLGLDRKDNDKGYEMSNIVLCCDRCNLIKSRFFTYSEMKFIGNRFVRRKWKQKGIAL